MQATGTISRRLGARGTTSAEFALVGGLLVSLLFGSIETGRHLYTVQSVRTATTDAMRLVTLRGSQNMNAGSAPCTGMSGALSGAAARAPFLDASQLNVTLSGCTTTSSVTTVMITVQYPFVFVLPLFGATNQPITDTAQAVFH